MVGRYQSVFDVMDRTQEALVPVYRSEKETQEALVPVYRSEKETQEALVPVYRSEKEKEKRKLLFCLSGVSFC